MIKPEGVKINNFELILTENCNLRCKYCFDDEFSDRSSCSYDYKMSLDKIPEIKNFIIETRDPERETSLSFFGGEPTMNWDFIVAFIDECKDLNLKYVMNSNILLLNTERIDFMIKHQIYPIISIDGIKESHDINRVSTGSTGSWDATMKVFPELVTKFRGIGLNPHTLMVVTNNNLHLLEKSYMFLQSLGVTTNILYNFNTTYTEDEYALIQKQLHNVFVKYNMQPYIDAQNRILNENYHNQPNYCHTPDRAITISPEGKTFFCHQLVPKMADIKDDMTEYYGDIKEGFTNLEYYEKMTDRVDIEKFKIGKKCEGCVAVKWCKGGCLASSRFECGNYDELYDTLCRINLILHDVFVNKSETLANVIKDNSTDE